MDAHLLPILLTLLAPELLQMITAEKTVIHSWMVLATRCLAVDVIVHQEEVIVPRVNKAAGFLFPVVESLVVEKQERKQH
jgi:hypothetical protein